MESSRLGTRMPFSRLRRELCSRRDRLRNIIRGSRRRSSATSVRGETLYRFHSRGLSLSRSLSLAPAIEAAASVCRKMNPLRVPDAISDVIHYASGSACQSALKRRRPARIWSRRLIFATRFLEIRR